MPRSFVPTEEQRQKVKAMAGFGLKQEQIAVLLGLSSVATLRKHFRQELTRGPIEAKVDEKALAPPQRHAVKLNSSL